jgi:hypothetical protein
VCCVTARTRPNAQISTIAASSEKQHAAWRHEIGYTGWNIPRRLPNVPFGYLARLQRAFAARPRPDPGPSGIIGR